MTSSVSINHIKNATKCQIYLNFFWPATIQHNSTFPTIFTTISFPYPGGSVNNNYFMFPV